MESKARGIELMAICKKCKEANKGMLAGQGFRDFTCNLCGEIDTWHNTNVPKICDKCSKEHNICQRCGEPLDEKEEKDKKRLFHRRADLRGDPPSFPHHRRYS